MKAQAALEYVIITGAILIIVISLFYYSSNKAKSDIKLNQAQDAVNALAKASNNVYSLGPGSRDYIWITIPESVASSNIDQENRIIQLTLNIFGGTSDIYAQTISNISGTIPTAKGTYRMQVQMLSDGVVYIGDVTDVTAPVISNIKPVDGSVSTSTEVELSLNTDEPAQCEYSDVQSFTYGVDGTSFETYSGYKTIHRTNPNLTLVNGTSYTYYFRCIDEFSNNNSESSPPSTSFLVWNDTDIYPPEIILGVEPADNRLYNTNRIEFNFTVSDNMSNISSCTIYAQGIGDDGNVMINSLVISQENITEYSQENTDNNNIVENALDKGTYLWNISCIDTSFWQNIGVSETRNLTVNVSFASSIQETCAGVCERIFNFYGGTCMSINDLSNGVCVDGCGISQPNWFPDNVDQVFSGETWPVGGGPWPDCWAWKLDTPIQYCTGRSTDTHCCCDPTPPNPS